MVKLCYVDFSWCANTFSVIVKYRIVKYVGLIEATFLKNSYVRRDRVTVQEVILKVSFLLAQERYNYLVKLYYLVFFPGRKQHTSLS